MRKYLILISMLIIIPLAGCNVLSGGRSQPQQIAGTATLSPDQAQTQVALMLTMLPTNTPQPQDTGSLPALPTVQVSTATAAEPAALPATNTPETVPTATLAPTATLVPTATIAVLPTSTQAPAPAFTAPPGDPRQRLGNPTSTDPMDNDTRWVWPTGSDKYTRATFTGGNQVITALDELDGWRMANPTGQDFANLYLEGVFRTNTCSGSDHYGLIVRVPVVHEPEQGYLFGVTCDGRYSLRRWNGDIGEKGEMKWLVNWTQTSAIATGSNQTNRLGIFTVGSRLILYVNGVLLTEVQDTTYPRGNFGVFVGQDETDNLSVAVDEMSYWENPQP